MPPTLDQWLPNLLWLMLLGSSLVGYLVTKPGETLRAMCAWVVILLGLVLLYSFRGEWNDWRGRVEAELFPSRGRDVQANVLEFRRANDGHFHVRLILNGKVTTDALFDTGASVLTLPLSMASSLGLDVRALRFTERFQTANGMILAAPITLRSVEVGTLRLENVRAVVTRSDLGVPLLGMSVVERFSRHVVEGDRLVLEW